MKVSFISTVTMGLGNRCAFKCPILPNVTFMFVQFHYFYSVVYAPAMRPGNSRAFQFDILQALLKAWHCVVKYVIKYLLKAPPPGS